MDLKFSEMSVDTTLAQEYLKKNELLLKLYNDFNGTIGKNAHGEEFTVFASLDTSEIEHKGRQLKFKNLASKLKQNATLIAQLEYHIRNIPIEETHAQINLLSQYLRSSSNPVPACMAWHHITASHCSHQDVMDIVYRPDDPLIALGYAISRRTGNVIVKYKAITAICHLLVTLQCEAGLPVGLQLNKESEGTSTKDNLTDKWPVKGLNSGTIAVVSDDADVDSAVDKFVSVSKQAPWRLRRILVQESVYQEFKDALTWKCNLNKSGSKAPTRNVVCSDTLTYNDRTFLIDPVQLIEDQSSVVIVEAYRTTKEMISLVQQYNAHYLSLWINGVAEINEVTHSTTAPVVWVNTIADFRGPPQVSHAVFSHEETAPIKKCAKVVKLCELSQSWLKLDFESRRDILCRVLDEYILLEPKNKRYTEIKHAILSCTQKSFVDVGKDYVCLGFLQPKGIITTAYEEIFSANGFESILQGNALIVLDGSSAQLELKGIPVVNIENVNRGDFEVSIWDATCFMRTRVIWTNSGTIFAN